MGPVAGQVVRPPVVPIWAALKGCGCGTPLGSTSCAMPLAGYTPPFGASTAMPLVRAGARLSRLGLKHGRVCFFATSASGKVVCEAVSLPTRRSNLGASLHIAWLQCEVADRAYPRRRRRLTKTASDYTSYIGQLAEEIEKETYASQEGNGGK